MRDTDELWMPWPGHRESMEVISEGQMQRLGFDLRSRKERMKDLRREMAMAKKCGKGGRKK